ncbi:MAG: RIP metalloprotease RseP [Oscillospiraceae bacterium]
MPSFDTLISFLITGVASVFVFGTVIFIHELGHFLTAKFSGIRVNEFALGMGPVLFSFTKGETKYGLRLFPIGGFVSMEGEDEASDAAGSFTKSPVSNRILVTVAGAFMNLVLGFTVLLCVVSMQKNIISRTVAEFNPNAITQQHGLKTNDTILAVNGRRCFIANDLSYEFARTQNGVADLTVLRNGEKVELKGVVFETMPPSEATGGTSQLKIDFKVYPTKKTVANVLKEAGNWTISLARMVVLSLMDLVTGRVAINNLSGPVGIVTAIGQASSIGFESVLLLLALISINLGVFNLMPLPALDGGRLVFLIIEAIRKKPVNPKYETAINTAGFMLLIGLMLFVTFNDITKLFH